MDIKQIKKDLNKAVKEIQMLEIPVLVLEERIADMMYQITESMVKHPEILHAWCDKDEKKKRENSIVFAQQMIKLMVK